MSVECWSEVTRFERALKKWQMMCQLIWKHLGCQRLGGRVWLLKLWLYWTKRMWVMVGWGSISFNFRGYFSVICTTLVFIESNSSQVNQSQMKPVQRYIWRYAWKIIEVLFAAGHVYCHFLSFTVCLCLCNNHTHDSTSGNFYTRKSLKWKLYVV